MTRDDLAEFTTLWRMTAARYDRSLSQDDLALDFKALFSLTIAEVRYGLTCHMQHATECRFHPFPGQIIGHVQAAREAQAQTDGRPGAEEAFTLVLAGRDEADTVVWTEEMSAAYNVAKPHLGDGNAIAARMAFREVYPGLVATARAAQKPVKWTPLLGHDPARRAAAIKAAIDSGKAIEGAAELPALPQPRESAAVALLAAPVNGSQAAATGKAALLALAERLKGRTEPASPDADGKAATATARDASAAPVAQYADGLGIELPPPAQVLNRTAKKPAELEGA